MGEFWGAFPPEKGNPCTFQNPPSENPLVQRIIVFFQEPSESRKGGFSTGGLCRVCVTPKETKNTKDIRPSSTFGTQSATAKKGVHFGKNPLLKPPLFSLSDSCVFPAGPKTGAPIPGY